MGHINQFAVYRNDDGWCAEQVVVDEDGDEHVLVKEVPTPGEGFAVCMDALLAVQAEQEGGDDA